MIPTRTAVALLENASGGDLDYGDVVILDASLEAFTTTTTSGFSDGVVGVIIEKNGIADGEVGKVATCGRVPRINLSATPNFGDLVKTHTVAGQGVAHASPRVEGDFAQVLSDDANPPAILFGSPTASIAISGALGIELDYVQITSDVTPNATTEGTANTVVTANEITLDGSTEVLIEFFSPICRPDNATDRTMHLVLYASFNGGAAASIGKIGYFATPDAGSDGVPGNARYRYTPVAGDYVYSIRAFVSAGTGLIKAEAGGSGLFMPTFIRITKANP